MLREVGRYRIIEELGRGGMATVYLARDPLFGREVAIKVLPREFLHDPKFRARFKREAKTIGTLEHPSIVPVYDFGEEQGQPFLVMRYLSGGSLADRLKDGPLIMAEAGRILSKLSPALDEVHTKGIVHRDLKPSNILFDQYGEPHLSDFGIVKVAQATQALTGAGIVGTPAYMSPEQVHGDMDLDGRSDIYSLGVVLFEMLTGQKPYEADTPIRLAFKHVHDPIPSATLRVSSLPSECDTIISKAMAKDIDDRYRAVGELAQALSELAEEQPAPSVERATPIPSTGPAEDLPLTTDQQLPSSRPFTQSAAKWITRRRASVALVVLSIIAGGAIVYQGGGVEAIVSELALVSASLATEALEGTQTGQESEIVSAVPTGDLSQLSTPPPLPTPSRTPTTALISAEEQLSDAAAVDEVNRTLQDVRIWLTGLENRISSPQAKSPGLDEAAGLHEQYIGWLANAESAMQEGDIELAKSLADRLVEALAPAPISLNSETLAQFECGNCTVILDEESGGFRVTPQDPEEPWRIGLKDQDVALGDYEIELRFKLLGESMDIWLRDSYTPTDDVQTDRHHAYAIRLVLRSYSSFRVPWEAFQKWVDKPWRPPGMVSPIVIGGFPVLDADTWYSLGISAMDNRVTITRDDKIIHDFRESTSPILFGGFNIGSEGDEVLIDSLKIEWSPYGE